MRPLAKWSLFLVSYLPLFLLLALRAWHADWTRGALFLVLSALGVAGAVWILVVAHSSDRTPPTPVRITAVEARAEDIAGYAVTYLLPFLTIDFQQWRDIVAVLGFLVVVGFLYTDSNLIYLNPTLALLRYRLFRIEYVTDVADRASVERIPGYLLTRREHLRVDSQLDVVDLADTVKLEISQT